LEELRDEKVFTSKVKRLTADQLSFVEKNLGGSPILTAEFRFNVLRAGLANHKKNLSRGAGSRFAGHVLRG
jgi:hypothetical protein